MYETGRRELPTGTMIKLADMMLFLNQNQKKDEQEIEPLSDQDTKIQNLIEKQTIELELKQIREQRKLAVITRWV